MKLEIKHEPIEAECSFCKQFRKTGLFGNHERTAFICRDCLVEIGDYVEKVELLSAMDEKTMTPQ